MNRIDNRRKREELDVLWNDILQDFPNNTIISKGYAIESEVEMHSILFVGMNPSFSANKWNNGNNQDSVIYDIPKISENKDTNTYFKTILSFYDSIKCPKPSLAHHDLLFVRETSQKAVLEMMRVSKLNCFFNEQLNISKTIIEQASPEIIVVLNAGARDLFKQLFGEPKSFSEKLGAQIYCINDKETPVLFSGMLSGQRALDSGSKESLKWHIEYILRRIMPNQYLNSTL